MRKKMVCFLAATGISTQILSIGTIVSNAQQVETGKARVTEGETIGLSNNTVEISGIPYNFYGENKENGFKIKFNQDSKTIQVIDKTEHEVTIDPYCEGTYFKFDLYGSDRNLKTELNLIGRETSDIADQRLSGQPFDYGDYITLYTPSDKLKINGHVINGNSNLNNSVSKDTMDNSCFRITRNGLVQVNIPKMLPNDIILSGRKFQSGLQQFRIRFNTGSKKIEVDNLGVRYGKINSRFSNKEYINVKLIRDDRVIKTVSLKGNDPVEKALEIGDMRFNIGDKIQIHHEEFGSKFKVTGNIENAEGENMSKGIQSDTVTFEITDYGLKKVNN